MPPPSEPEPAESVPSEPTTSESASSLERASLVRQARWLMVGHGLRPRKRLGQNFLVDPHALERIIAAADLSPDDVVVEVGPGLGFLSRLLLARARRVIAVELDEQLAAILRETLGSHPNLRVVQADVLKVDPAALVSEHGDRPAAAGYKVVANLPYYITSPTLRLFLESAARPRRMVVMVQKEVAQRISARPGEMSLLSVMVQIWGRPTIVRYVPARSFYPPPQVDSALVRIDVYDRPAVEVDDIEQFFVLVAAGFSQPRKQIHNALAQRLWFPPGGATALLEAAGIDPRRRAQTLSLPDWERLYKLWRAMPPEPSTDAEAEPG